MYSERPKNGFCSIAAGTWWRCCCWWCGAKLEDSWCFVNWAYALAAPRFELKNLCDWKFCFEASVSSRTWKGSFVSSPRPVTSTSTSSSEESSSLSSELPVDAEEEDNLSWVGFSHTEWVSLCRLRSQFLLKTLWHWLHSYGLWSVWVRRWVFKFDRWLKLRWHTGHLCGDSSM